MAMLTLGDALTACACSGIGYAVCRFVMWRLYEREGGRMDAAWREGYEDGCDDTEASMVPGPPGDEWEPAPGDAIVAQAGHHYDPSSGTAPGAGLSQSAATAAGPEEGTTDAGYGLLHVLPDRQAFGLIRWELAHLHDNLWEAPLALPAWSDRRAA